MIHSRVDVVEEVVEVPETVKSLVTIVMYWLQSSRTYEELWRGGREPEADKNSA